jgi:tetratricopeptide (TPR) repeat protein
MKRPISRGLFLPALLLLALLVLPLIIIYPSSLPPGCLETALSSVSPGDPEHPASSQAVVANCIPWRVDLWESAGMQALQAGDPRAAVQFFERAQSTAARFGRPTTSALTIEGLMALGDAYQQTGNSSAALRAWKTVAALGGLSREEAIANGLKIAHGYLAQGDYPAAIGFWQYLADLQPQDAQTHFQLGLLLATQDPETALGVLDEAASLDAKLEEPVSSLRSSIMSARFAENPAYTLVLTGRALANLNRWSLAAEAFHQATRLRPDYAEAWAYWGEALQHPDSTADAASASGPQSTAGLAELQKAVALDPKSLAAQTLLSIYWVRQGRYEQALETIRTALELAPENPVLVSELASILAVSGDLEQAYRTYQRAAALSPYDPLYLRLQVNFSLRYGYQVAQIALPLARKLVVQDPQNPINLDLMAQVFIRQGDLVNAERFLLRLLEANPDFAPAHLHLGLLYLLQGDQTAAYQELARTISLAPGSPEARQAQQAFDRSTP